MMRTIIRNIIRTIIGIVERTPIENQTQKNIIDRQKFLQDFELDNKDGFTFGTLRLADLNIDLINNIIYQENYKIAQLEAHISPEHKELYDHAKAKRKLLTYEEFIKLDYPINERSRKIYKNDLDGYFEYIQDIKPQLANFFLDYFQPYFKDIVRNCMTFIIGITGIGKSEVIKNIVYNHARRKNCAIILIEPHGDLTRETYESKIFLDPEQAERLVIIDNRLSDDKTPIINIFDQIKCDNEEDLDTYSQNLARALTGLCSQGQSAEMTGKMETTLRFCVRVVLRKKHGCLLDLLRFMTSNNADLVELGKNDPNILTREYFENGFFETKSQETKGGIYHRLQGIIQNTNFINLTTGKSTINIANVMNTKKILVVRLTKGSAGEYTGEAFGKLLIALIKTIMFARDKQPKWLRKERLTHVFVDEFQNYMSNDIETILTEGRKYEVFFTLASQFVGQGLTSQETDALLGNTGMKIVAQTVPSNSAIIAKDIFVKPEQINKLAQGEFYLQYANSKKIPITIKIKGSEKYLGDSYKNNENLKELKEVVIAKYYIKRGSYPYYIPQTPQNENKTHNKKPFNKKDNRRNGDKPNFNDSDF